MTWNETKFESIYAEPSRNGVYKPQEFRGTGYKMVNMGELFANDFINTQPMDRIQLTDAELSRSQLLEGDLLFGRRSLIEKGAGKCSLVTKLDEPTTFESSLIRVRLDKDKVSPRFFFYYLSSPVGRGRVRAIVTGTNVKGIRASVLKSINVHLPPLPEQEKISEVLSTYDYLLENNRRRIELLVRAARLIYEEWFVRLRFPGYEYGHVLNGLPDGWERSALGNALTLQRGFDLPVGQRQSGPHPIFASTGENGFHNEAKVKGPGVVTGRSGSLGTVLYIPTDFWPLNTTLWIKEFKRVPPIFAFYLLSSLNLERLNGGAAVPTLNRNDVHRIEVLLPKEEILSSFDEIVQPIFKQQHVLERQNLKLQKARDLLLSRLMRGELQI